MGKGNLSKQLDQQRRANPYQVEENLHNSYTDVGSVNILTYRSIRSLTSMSYSGIESGTLRSRV